MELRSSSQLYTFEVFLAFLEAGSMGVLEILTVSEPLKIRYLVVLFVPINVINCFLSFWIKDECACHCMMH